MCIISSNCHVLFKRSSCLPFSPKHVIVKYLLKLPALGQVAPWLCQGLGREGVCGGRNSKQLRVISTLCP